MLICKVLSSSVNPLKGRCYPTADVRRTLQGPAHEPYSLCPSFLMFLDLNVNRHLTELKS